MKKYNRLILLSVLLWLTAATGAGYVLKQKEVSNNTAYKLEINRLYNSLSAELEADRLNLGSCEYVKKVSVLSVEELADERKVRSFYESDNHLEADIRPVCQDGVLKGFVRFDYSRTDISFSAVCYVVESAMLLMELFLLAVLFYLKYQLIKPFELMEQIPYELAQGHLKRVIKEEKNRYYGWFLWGIGLLKDTLEVSKKRTLELEKEKKTLLLSLSHDIKTPLNHIKLYAKALEEDLYEDVCQKHHAAHRIGEKTLEIEKYVAEIMKHSREDILDIQVEKGQFYLADLMKKVLDIYQEKCETRLIELQVESFENCLLNGDINRTVEVFENLFENAFKYGDGRRMEISFSEEEDYRLIRIFNTGEPVSENDFNHIFESFFRAANSKGQAGNGLGLYICREIMRKMEGTIYAERCADGMAFVLVFE